MNATLTCVYCGHQYPEGTPPHGAQILTDHIQVCDKHPMKQCFADCTKLRAALVGIVGADGRQELDEMALALRLLPAPAADKAASLDAIQVLIETLPDGSRGGAETRRAD